MNRTLWLGIGTLLVVIAIQGLRIVASSGLLITVETRPLSCRAIPGVTGAEDITVDPRTGYAYLSADDRRATQAGRPVAGAIHGIDMTERNPVPRLLWQGGDTDFHPHGISLYLGDGSDPVLMVISHSLGGGHSVELFAAPARGELEHRERITFAELVSPNDLVAVGARAFYVANDHGSSSGWRQFLEEYLVLPFANVVYFDGEAASVVATGFRYANGIAVTKDGSLLVVAETTGRRIQVFRRDADTGALEHQSAVALDTGADNLEWAPNGELLVAGHPRLFDFIAHSADASALSPSQVLSVALGATPELTELYVNDGSELSGGSVAAAYGGRILLGSVFEEKVLLCEL